MWRIEREEDYYRIYDSRRDIAAYLDPDYGLSYDDEGVDEKIDEMVRRGSSVRGGYVMVPMAKFGIFDTDYNANIASLQESLGGVVSRVERWREFAESWPGGAEHHVRISHTDHDMLSVTFYVPFGRDVRLKNDELIEAVTPMLDELAKRSLL